ncbi:MAG: hypothetical protein JXM79_00955 [Sedimentisphaerales bacterium]|nr:hypothetical protein [Sedimentisphaerales bacterium]
MDTCKLCGGKLDEADIDSNSSLDTLYLIHCPRCSVYTITDCAIEADLDPFVEKHLHLISAMARWRSEKRSRLHIEEKLLVDRSEFESQILSVCPRSVEEKTNNILRYVAEKSSYPGAPISFNKELDYPLFYCKGQSELTFYLDYLKNRGLLGEISSGAGGNWRMRLSVDGCRKVEELAKQNIESKQAFVAMWFDDRMKSVYSEGIKKLEEDTNFMMLRIDMKQFNEKICDRILAEIRRSRFLIADVTEHRQGVYFEAGFAMGLGLPVIWTCREDQIKKCHFDTRQYNHVTWKDADELRGKLKDRIIATIGQAS